MQALTTLSLLLLSLSTVFAQPVPPPPADAAANTNAASTVPRRRFQRPPTNVVTTATNALPAIPRPGAFPAPPPAGATAPVSVPSTNVPLPSVPTATNVIVPDQATAAGTTNVIVNQPVIAPPPQTPAIPQPGEIEPNRSAREIRPIPAPGEVATTPPAPGTAVPGTPATLPPNSTEAATANVPVSASALAPGYAAEDVIGAGEVDLQMMPLELFLDLYGSYSGRTVIRPMALANTPLTLKAQTALTRRELIEAMDSVLALNNVTMIPMGEKFVKAVPSTQADKEGAPISKATSAELPDAEQFVTRIVKLNTAKPSEIAQTLVQFAKTATAVTPIDSNQTLILRDYASNVKRMLEIIEKVDVMPEVDFTLEVIPIKYGKVSDIYATMSGLIYGGAGGGAAPGGFGTAAPGGAGAFGAGGFRGGGAFGGMNRSGGAYGGMNRGGYGGSMNRGSYGGGMYGGSSYGGGGSYYPMQELDDQQIFPQQVAPPAPGGAATAQQDFRSRLNSIINRAANPQEIQVLENARIVPDDRSNRLLIFANKRDMAMITNIVNKVDVLLAQVLIEAIILEVKLGDSLNLGVSSAQHPKQFGKDFLGAGAVNNGQPLFSTVTNFPAGAPEGFSYLGKIGDDFEVAITALAKDNQINILSRPRIQTSHAIPGFFFIGETVPYVTGFTDYGGVVGGSLSTRSSVQERTIGLNLNVTPFITPEGMVVMEIDQNFDQRGGEVLIDGNPVPLVNSRQASAMLTVRDGDIIMLGGFISDSRSKSHSGVPFLKDIPGLGVLFRSKADKNDRTELIILMKATVLESPEDAALLADRERLQLPGVRQAEREFIDAETKRMKKVEKKLKR